MAGVAIQSRFSASDFKLFLWLCISFSVFPDIDGAFSSTVAGHHSVLHTPIFWIMFCLLIYVFGRKYYPTKNLIIALGIFSGAFLHLLTDWITARTVGIQWFYPLLKTDYYLYPISREQGQVSVYEMIVDPYWSFYMENKLLFGFEVIINVIAIFLIMQNIRLMKKDK